MSKDAIKGMKELEKMFKQLGKVPQTVATRAARAGATVALKAARENAPTDSGSLKKGIVLKRERRKVQGKAVYDVTMDAGMNDVFVKTSKDGKRSYYPASQEFGFLTRDGGYTPGYGFLRRSIDDNRAAITDKTLETAGKAIEKVLKS